MIEVDEADLRAFGGAECRESVEAVLDERVRESGHVAAGDFSVREEGSVEVGDVDCGNEIFDASAECVPLFP